MATARRIDRLRSVAAARQAGLTVVLEDIHDPHNAEAVFRSCDAFGVQQIHLVFEHEAPFKPRRVGKASSASANKWLSFTVHRSTAECLRALRASGHVLAAAAPPPQGRDPRRNRPRGAAAGAAVRATSTVGSPRRRWRLPIRS